MNKVEQIKEMMDIQNELNSQLNADWKNANWNFSLAARIEMMEAVEHYGWKWWKHQKPDINQVKMEMADIWHFLLSELIVQNANLNPILCEFEYLSMREFEPSEFVDAASDFVSGVEIELKFYHFFKCLKVINMSFEELRLLYLGKAILNKFRWNNGYSDGTYVKTWDGLEDNEYLTSILTCHPEAKVEDVYGMLEKRYKKLTCFKDSLK